MQFSIAWADAVSHLVIRTILFANTRLTFLCVLSACSPAFSLLSIYARVYMVCNSILKFCNWHLKFFQNSLVMRKIKKLRFKESRSWHKRRKKWKENVRELDFILFKSVFMSLDYLFNISINIYGFWECLKSVNLF